MSLHSINPPRIPFAMILAVLVSQIVLTAAAQDRAIVSYNSQPSEVTVLLQLLSTPPAILSNERMIKAPAPKSYVLTLQQSPCRRDLTAFLTTAGFGLRLVRWG